MTSEKDYEEFLREQRSTIDAALVETFSIELHITNTYEELDDPIVTTPTAQVPLPEPDEDLDEWAQENLYDLTGTGHETGDSWYDVEITKFDARPDLVGRVFELGDY